MGNKAGKRKVVVDEQFTRPQGLYEHREIDLRRLQKYILEGKLSPCYAGADEATGQDLEECPICLLCYPSLNRSKCCGQGICTECFLQLRSPTSSRAITCPFCKTPTFAVEYRGEKTAEEKDEEHEEQQRVLEARIRMLAEERRQDEERQELLQDPSLRHLVHQELVRQQLTLGPAPSASAPGAAPDPASTPGAAVSGGEGGPPVQAGSAATPPSQRAPGASGSRSGILGHASKAETLQPSKSSRSLRHSSSSKAGSSAGRAHHGSGSGGGGRGGIQPSQLLLPRPMLQSSSSSSTSSAGTPVAAQQAPAASGNDLFRLAQQRLMLLMHQQQQEEHRLAAAEEFFDLSVFAGEEEVVGRATPYTRLSLTPEYQDRNQPWLARPRGSVAGTAGRGGASGSGGVTPNNNNAAATSASASASGDADASGALALSSPPGPPGLLGRAAAGPESPSPTVGGEASGVDQQQPLMLHHHHHQHVHQHIHEHLFEFPGPGAGPGRTPSGPRGSAEAAVAAAAEAAVSARLDPIRRLSAYQQIPGGSEELGMDLDDILLMQAVWLSLQEQTGNQGRGEEGGPSAGMQIGSLEGGRGVSETPPGASVPGLSSAEGHTHPAHPGTSTEGAAGRRDLASAGAREGAGGLSNIPEDFEEQMKLAMTLSLAEANELSAASSQS